MDNFTPVVYNIGHIDFHIKQEGNPMKTKKTLVALLLSAAAACGGVSFHDDG